MLLVTPEGASLSQSIFMLIAYPGLSRKVVPVSASVRASLYTVQGSSWRIVVGVGNVGVSAY